jgi:hypothetical protein
LSELTDDGEVLRSIAALVAVLELEERASGEHALLSYVYATGDFPPGSFRELMTLITEEQTFVEVLKTNASTLQFSEYQARMKDPRLAVADDLRRAAVESIDGDLEAREKDWFSAQGAKVDSLRTLEERLNRDVRTARPRANCKTPTAPCSPARRWSAPRCWAACCWPLLIGRGVTRSVHTLRGRRQPRRARLDRRARGAPDQRRGWTALGNAFNDMTERDHARPRSAARANAHVARSGNCRRHSVGAAAASLTHPELEFAGRMQPAEEVGGDFYDVLSTTAAARCG